MLQGGVVSLILIIISLALGLPLNAFIMTIGFKDWIKRKSQSPADLLLFAEGLSTIVIQIFNLLESVTWYFFSDLFISLKLYIFYTIYFSVMLSSSWVTAWLCTFYCIKIVTFQNRLISYLKSNFSMLLPRLLSGSIVLSFSLMTMLLAITFRYTPFISTINSTWNVNLEDYSTQENTDILFYGMEVQACMSMLLTLISMGLIINSLRLHVLRLHRGSSTIRFSQLKPHVNAGQKMALLLILQISYYIAKLNVGLSLSSYRTTWQVFCAIIYYFYGPLQALIMILVNRKLSLACGVFSCNNKGKLLQAKV